MNTKLLSTLAGAAALFAMQGATPALAIPELQLDIENGTYSGVPLEDTIIQDNNFTLGAIYNSIAPPSTTYYLSFGLLTEGYQSVASLPSGASITITVDGASYTFDAGDFTFGTPVPGDEIASHGVFDTTYAYLTFGYDANDPRILNYDAQTFAGDWTDTSACSGDECTGTLKTFDVELSGLEGYAVHFDFFYIDGKGKPTTAPFSHDATGYSCDPESDPDGCDGPPPPPQGLPEPGTLLLLGAGLLGLGAARRRKA